MNIQGVTQNIPSNASTGQSNPRLKAVDKQISDTQKRIQEVRGDEKLDPKTKTEKIKECEQQIQSLQQERAQIQAEERQSKQKAAADSQPPVNQEAESEIVDKHVQNAFVQMDSMKKTEKTLGFVREQAKGELRMAESKSYLRDSNPAAAAKARAKLAKADRDMLHKAKGVSEELSGAAKEAVPAPKDERVEEESDREYAKNGTGRMEPGQFLDDEA